MIPPSAGRGAESGLRAALAGEEPPTEEERRYARVLALCAVAMREMPPGTTLGTMYETALRLLELPRPGAKMEAAIMISLYKIASGQKLEGMPDA